MVDKISFSNYKAFEFGEIELKPITILLGANSSGKSSVLQLILMLAQTAGIFRQDYRAALKLHGKFVSLGESINLIRKKDFEKNIELTFDVPGHSIETFTDKVVQNVSSIIAQSHSPHQKINTKIKSKKSKSFKDIFSSESQTLSLFRFRYNTDLDLLDELATQLELSEDEFKKISRDTEKDPNLFLVTKNSIKQYKLLFDFIRKLKRLKGNSFSVKFQLTVLNKLLVTNSIQLFIDDEVISEIKFEHLDTEKNNFQVQFNSIFLNRKLYEKEIKNLHDNVNPFTTIFSIFKKIESYDDYYLDDRNILTWFICRLFNLFIDDVEFSFNEENINYVSPLRAHPKRYYFIDDAKVNNYLDTLDGDALAEILKDNSTLRNDVNKWFSNFNVNIKVSPLEDIIHRLQVDHNNVNLDITDVGFGISQVLPVIVQGFLSSNGSITLIEQPEIHLHPKMQAELGDLFIDIIKPKQHENRKKLVIETHSEYLLKRLRRRISDGTLSNDDVALYWVSPQNGDNSATLKKVEISKTGSFEWPDSYYLTELVEDTVEFLNNQSDNT